MITFARLYDEWEYHPIYGEDSRLIYVQRYVDGEIKETVSVYREYRDHII